jgi:putative intracellular protease/amidase
MKELKILIIATSHENMGNTAAKTGLWLEELATPYYIFREAGASLSLSSPKGGIIPLDPKSLSLMGITGAARKFLRDAAAMAWLEQAIPLENILPRDYDMVFIPGGHGPMWDLGDNPVLCQLLTVFIREGKPLGAVCHGVAGLLSLQAPGGEPFIKGRHLTGFSNSEEVTSGLSKIVPFLLETELISGGALYTQDLDFTSHVVVDGLLVTGQNPASSRDVALAMLKVFREKALHQFSTIVLS